MAKSNAPTIFQINGPIGYESWKDYCLELSDSRIYELLSDKSLAITSEGGVYAIPYAVEGYGIIYNEEILERYFDLPNKTTSLSSVDEIRSFDALRSVVEDMQRNAGTLGIKGVFASTSLPSQQAISGAGRAISRTSRSITSSRRFRAKNPCSFQG